MEGGTRRIWVDLDNTPHVPFFLPIIRALEDEGHTVIVTARDAFQVCGLADYHGLKYHKVGRHYGRNRAMKIGGTVWRALQLLPFVLSSRPDISMSHGSRALELVSHLLGIPSMLIFDYEHAVRLPLVKPAIGVAPSAISDEKLAREFKYGLRQYDGLKEDVYAATFVPDSKILTDLEITPEEILVTIRPPATEAHYHNREAEMLFVEVVTFLGALADVRMVILPRTAGAQADFVRQTWPELCREKRIIIPNCALDGLNLIWFSDLVVSGGGTMNREAAALGVPVYSIFRGKLGGVDQLLARQGRLILLETPADVKRRLKPIKRTTCAAGDLSERAALRQILDVAYELMERVKHDR